MDGFELFLGVGAYSAFKFTLSCLVGWLLIWSVWGLYKDRKGIKAELDAIEKDDDRTPVDMIGYKTVKRTLWKLFFVIIFIIFAKSGIVKMVESKDTSAAREALSLPTQSQRTRTEIPTAAEIKAKRLADEQAAKKRQAEIDAEEVAAQKAKSEAAIKDSLENQKQNQ